MSCSGKVGLCDLKGRIVGGAMIPVTKMRKDIIDNAELIQQIRDKAGVDERGKIKYYNLREKEFIALKMQEKIDELREDIAEMSDKNKRARKGKVIRTSGKELKILERELNQLMEVNNVEYMKTAINDLHQDYVQTIKKAISKGIKVPNEVMNMYRDDFEKTQEGRDRYDKAWRTSYKNKTAGIDKKLRDDIGIKIKMQNGKKVTKEARAEVVKSIQEITEAFGEMGDDLKQIYRDYDVTVAHTNGKQPFAKNNAIGLYTPSERCVSAGWRSRIDDQSMRQTAHEIGHFLDNISSADNVDNFKKGNTFSKFKFFSTSDPESIDFMDTLRQSCRQLDDADIAKAQKMQLKDTGIEIPVRKKYERIKYVLGRKWANGEELWARGIEQYVSTKLTKQGKTGLASVDDDYSDSFGYWDKKTWEKLEPLMEKEIKRRIDAIKAAKDRAVNA